MYRSMTRHFDEGYCLVNKLSYKNYYSYSMCMKIAAQGGLVIAQSHTINTDSRNRNIGSRAVSLVITTQ